MKSGGMILVVIPVGVISILGYYNFQYQKTIDLLNGEILEQARLRHNLILEKHVLENNMKVKSIDSMSVRSEL